MKWIQESCLKIGFLFLRIGNRNSEVENDRKFLNDLYREAGWHERLWKLTDKEIAMVIGYKIDFPFGSLETVLIGEAITRLHRSEGKENPAN